MVNSVLKIFIIRRQRKKYLVNNILFKYSINTNNTYYTKQKTQFKKQPYEPTSYRHICNYNFVLYNQTMALDFIVHINYDAHPVLNLLSSALIPLFAAGFGAFCGSAINQRNKEFNDYKLDIQYIAYANSILFALLDSLYQLKKQFICDENVILEMELLEKVRFTTFSQVLNVKIENIKDKFNQFKFCSKKIIVSDCLFPINEEKLKILADVNMNIFNLIVSCRESLMNINEVIKQLNEHVCISEDDIRKTAFDGYYSKWYELRNIFATCVDDSIVCIILLIECLNKSGTILSKKYKRISFNTIPVDKLKINGLYPKIESPNKKLSEWVK